MAIGSPADLLNLLATCLPDDEELEKAAQIETLVSMPAYQTLEQSTEFHEQFEQYYSPRALSQLSVMQIRKARGAVPVVEDCLRAIRSAVQHGPGPSLRPDDKPDFYSGLSLRALAERLQGREQVNYTNIPDDKFMEVFSPDTIRSAPEVFGVFSADTRDPEAETARVCEGHLYCVSAGELDTLEDNYQQSVYAMEHEGRSSSPGWLGWRRNRIFLALGVFMATAAVNFLSGNLTNLIGLVTCGSAAVLGVILAIWG